MTLRLAAAAALMQRRPALAAIALGLIAACAYPPLHLWPLGLAALAGFVWLIHSAENWRSACARGWWFGWAHLTLANNWIATAFTHQAKMPEALGWAAVPLSTGGSSLRRSLKLSQRGFRASSFTSILASFILSATRRERSVF